MVNRNHFFRFYQKDESSESKVKFRQANGFLIIAKGFLKLPNLHILIKQESITSQKLGITNSFLNKDKSAIPLLFNSTEVLSSASDKTKLFAENFSKNSNLDDSGISLPIFPSRTNLKVHNISITPKMVEKVIMNLDLSKHLVLIVFLW